MRTAEYITQGAWYAVCAQLLFKIFQGNFKIVFPPVGLTDMPHRGTFLHMHIRNSQTNYQELPQSMTLVSEVTFWTWVDFLTSSQRQGSNFMHVGEISHNQNLDALWISFESSQTQLRKWMQEGTNVGRAERADGEKWMIEHTKGMVLCRRLEQPFDELKGLYHIQTHWLNETVQTQCSKTSSCTIKVEFLLDCQHAL